MPRTLELDIELHPNQFKVRNDKSRFRVLVAGRRWGKTILAIDELIENALQSKYPCWYVAPTYRQAKMIAWDMLLSKIPPEIIEYKNEVELEVKLIAGAPICLKGADNEDSLRGVALGFVVMDEHALIKPNVWPEIIRPMLTDTKGRALFIGTPKGKNSLWELYIKGLHREDGYSSYCFKTTDNPFIDPSEVEDARHQLNERYFRQEYEASFEDYTGLIWPEFNYKHHVIESKSFPEYLEHIGAIDPANTGTTAALFAVVDTDGVLNITGEYYEQNKRVSEISSAIKSQSQRWYIDPAVKGMITHKEGKDYSLYDEFCDNGITSLFAEHNVDGGINRVAEYFKADKIRIFSTCKNLIYELERYHWSEERETVGGILKPKPFKSLDHACDCLRYLIMSRFMPIERKEELNPASAWGRYQLVQQDKGDFQYSR